MNTISTDIAVAAFLAAAASLGFSGDAQANPPGDLPHKGAFTCDFELLTDPSAPPDAVAGLIAHDSILMKSSDAATGFKHKVIPVSQDPVSGQTYSGGRYLFDKWSQARSYETFVKEEFHTFDPVTGEIVQFLDRHIFRDPQCFSWKVVGAAEYSDFTTTTHLVRTERYAVDANDYDYLKQLWQDVRVAADLEGMSAAWLLYNGHEGLASIVLFAPRTTPDPTVDLLALKARPSLLAVAAVERGWAQQFSEVQFALSVWLPFEPGDQGQPDIFPNPDFLPFVPSTSDGFCIPSRGETAMNDAACLPACGNAACDTGEDWLNCPADVSPYRSDDPACTR
jgi:hypothetical protein